MEYFSELLNAHPPATPITNREPEWDKLDIDMSDPNEEEIKKCIKQLKNHKAAGYDDITGEMLKSGGKKLEEWLTRICKIVWKNEKPPEDWKKGVIIKLPKKGDLTICSNNRGITLLSVAGKVFCSFILNRFKGAIDKKLRENQAGFRPGRSCTDQIFALRQIIEKCLEFHTPIKINFIDFKAAFDSVHRESLWNILIMYGIPIKIVNIIRNTYEKSECCVQIDGEKTEWFEITAGVRQGCIWSPLLFLILIDYILKHSLDDNKLGMVLEKRISSRYPEQKLSDLAFADDIALLDNTEEMLQKATDEVASKGAKAGLIINVKKTKVMHVNNTPEDINVNILGSEPLENVTDFTYLGSTLSYNGSLSTELDSRIGKASAAYNKLRPVLNNKKISTSTRLRIFQAVVVSTLLYSSETWNLTIKEENRLAAFYNRCLRRILCITWEDKVSTEELLKRACSPNLKTLLRRKRFSWFGIICLLTSNSTVV